MKSTSDTRQVLRCAVRAPVPAAADGHALEAWLRRDLCARYDGTLVESLPSELLALLNR
jgi:hypothetical protein